MLGFLGVLTKSFIALCCVLLFLVALGIIALLFKFAGVIALGFLLCVLAYVLVCECWDALIRHWAKTKGS